MSLEKCNHCTLVVESQNSREGQVLTGRNLSLVRVQKLHIELPVWLALQPEAVILMQHHVGIGMVHGIGKGHRPAALVLVHVKQLAGQGVLHEPLEGLHHLGYQLVQGEQHIAVGTCMYATPLLLLPCLEARLQQCCATVHGLEQAIM